MLLNVSPDSQQIQIQFVITAQCNCTDITATVQQWVGPGHSEEEDVVYPVIMGETPLGI